MRQVNFTYDDICKALDDLSHINALLKGLQPSKSLFHIYVSGISITQANLLIETIDKYFPGIPRIGISEFPSYSQKNNLLIKINLIISDNCYFYPFQLDCNRGQEKVVAENFIQTLKNINNVKGIEVCYANQLIDISTFIEILGKEYPDIAIFGSASKQASIVDNKVIKDENSFSLGQKVQTEGLTLIVYTGNNLEINLNYIQTWRPIGREMRFQLADNPLLGSSAVAKIDNTPAIELFNKYLGIPLDDSFINNAWYFPLLIKRNNTNICFTPIGCKNSTLYYGGRMYEDELIQFSYCTREEILDASFEESKKISALSPEALLLILCCNRYVFMKEEEKDELSYYKNCANEFAYCHSYGEIAYKNQRGGALNSALVSIVLREVSAAKQIDSQFFSPPKIRNFRNSTIPIPFIISHFFHEITRDLVNYQDHLKNEVEKISHINENLSLHIVQTLADAIDAKDRYTNGHSGRVAEYARKIAKIYGYSDNQLLDVYMTGVLHDVGKIGVPDYVINKKAKLTADEYNAIKEHTTIGAHILSNIKEIPNLVTGARWHHEHYDGSGYPDGLKGNDIPEVARIIAVADAYDAMTSNRSYRDALPQSVVRQEIYKGKNKQFDPSFADIMLDIIDNDREYRLRDFSECQVNKLLNLGLDGTDSDTFSDAKHLSFTQLVDFGRSMPGGFFVYKAHGDEEILYVNDIVLDIFGCSKIEDFKDLTGLTFPGMVHEADLRRIQNSISQQVTSNDKKLDYVEYRIRRKDGYIRWVDDYGRLVNTIEYGEVYFVLIRDITEQHNTRENLVEMDHLTKAYNRRHFDREIIVKTNHMLQSGGRLCMIMIDIDKFKNFNDVYGHPAGDKCLSQVAGAMMKTLRRKNDVLYRYGGEEFAILLADTTLEGAAVVAENLRLAVRGLNICHEKSPHGIVTISAGVGILEDEEAGSITNPSAELIHLADKALSEAKKAGRDSVKCQKSEFCVLR